MGSTLTKLRYRPGMRVAVLGAPAGFEAELVTAKGVERVRTLEKDLDLVQAFFTRRSNLDRELTRLKGSLGPKGILWLCYPKGRALDTDLNRDVVRELAARKGLRAVSIVAVDAVWSALRCKLAGGR
jgi:hypothetical protein